MRCLEKIISNIPERSETLTAGKKLETFLFQHITHTKKGEIVRADGIIFALNLKTVVNSLYIENVCKI